jgi:hypothetical protein
LNYLDQSHLNAALKSTLYEELQKAPLLKQEFDNRSEMVLNEARTELDALAYPEMLMEIGYLQAQNGSIADARDTFLKARDWYQNNSQEHRAAVSGWAAGEIQWRTRENEKAYQNWDQARKIFAGRIAFLARRRLGSAVKWYVDTRMAMNIELAKTAEEAYEWLNVAEPVYIDRVIFVMANQMLDGVRAGKFASTGKIIEALQSHAQKSHNVNVLPQILAGSGLVASQMQMPGYAVDLIREAAVRFRPYSHRHASALWMLGCVLFTMEGCAHEALQSWRDGLIGYHGLADEADRRNDQVLHAWYRSTIEVMERALYENTLETGELK